MSENQLLTVLATILQKKGNEMNNNELFGILSLMLLHEVIDIYKVHQQSSLPAIPDKEITGNNSSISNITSLLSKANTGTGNSSGIQELLPLLISTLGSSKSGSNNSGSDIDVGTLLTLINSLNTGKKENEPESDNEIETEKTGENNVNREFPKKKRA
ncbi:hypothetical protein [Halothermothrix orenii]|uniref:Uncharacterized protein n=1 Tax=Halothermothrix orenii (strain H 168 / OCM 544 / DSM 9562) TaxID=373903 RepID=B8D0I5_HALOH|nr:hypothetical protein [Halothermothrix orenii]ACL70921.1 hypothetical protein Hore_21750 [Halothermothrix orenii H 168]